MEHAQTVHPVAYVPPPRQYSCCFHALHIVQGSFIIGLICSLVTVFSVLDLLGSDASGTLVNIQLLREVVNIICLVLMFVGLSKKKKELVLPFSILLMVTGGIYIFFGFLMVFSSSKGVWLVIKDLVLHSEELERILQEYYGLDHLAAERVVTYTVFVCLLIVACICEWWAKVILRCYNFLYELELENQQQQAGSRVDDVLVVASDRYHLI